MGAKHVPASRESVGPACQTRWAAVLPVLMSLAAWAQPPVATTDQTARYAEPLTAILERGFPRNVFVCGPFPADVPDGIIRAAAEGGTVLGQRDFMSPLGGVGVTRPVPLLAVGGPEAVWQSAQITSPVLDFSSLFQGREEGIAYGAFYLTADAETPVFFESHTPFGARWWVNGTPYRDIRQGSLAETGADRFLVILVAMVAGASASFVARNSDV